MTNFRWITDVFTTRDSLDFHPSSVITSRGSFRPYRSFNNRSFLGTSTNFIEKLQKDRERDSEFHLKSLESIPRQLRSPSKQKFYFPEEQKIASPRKQKKSYSQSVYLRHGHVPPIHSKILRKPSNTDSYCVEPLAIDRGLVVNLNSRTTPRSDRSHPCESDTSSSRTQKFKRFQAVRVKSSEAIIHDRPIRNMKSLERLQFVNPLLKGRRVEKDFDRNSLYDLESNTAMSAIRSVQEYNDPKDDDDTPDPGFTVEDVFKIKPS
ncbi:hypothetical protein SNE40_014832 [Patella caerulea]|uniref:Uncharacterized protein n=1 Tax=Patella caerulea TaxID=87958 RepID=A0AAN8JFB8_PATCE